MRNDQHYYQLGTSPVSGEDLRIFQVYLAEAPTAEYYRETASQSADGSGVQKVRDFLANADTATWNRARPQSSPLSANEYKNIWHVISGESR